MEYQDFDLSVDREGDAYRARLLDGGQGVVSVAFTLPFDEVKLENVLLRLGRTRRGVRRVESSEMTAAKSFGGALFSAIFAGDVGAAFQSRAEKARQEGRGLRIRLRLAEPSLADLPWEYLYNPAVNRFLALSVHTPLVRYLDLPDAITPFAVRPPIRVLVMISSPADYPALDVEAEWSRLNESLADLCAAGTIAIDRLDNPTLSVLQRRLRRSQYHIFHFIGHGEFDRTAEEGVLVLEDERHRGHRVSSQYLGMLLHDHESLRVAVLNACEGARTSRTDPFAGTAQTLVQQGIPAVIAMQFEIADDVASGFAHEFYGAIADGYPVDAALTEARKAIFAAGRDVEWGTPVLYLRAADGRIFDVDRAASAAAEPISDEAQGPAQAPAQPAAPNPEPAVPVATSRERALGLVQNADVALANGEFAEALTMLEQARTLDPGVPGLREALDAAGQQQAVAETRALRKQKLNGHLASAGELLDRRDLNGAAYHVKEALRMAPRDRAALALQDRVRRARDVARQREQPPASTPPPSISPRPAVEHAVGSSERTLSDADAPREKTGGESDLLDE